MNNEETRQQPPRWLFALTLALSLVLTACSLPQVTAEQRTFLDLSLEFIGEYQLPKIPFENTTVGGLSALAYDRQRDYLYALSDDRSQQSPARFYTLKLTLNPDASINKIDIKKVAFLKTEDNKPYPPGTIDPEGIALTPEQTVLISSEGDTNRNIAPFIAEFDLQTGRKKQSLPISDRYLADAPEDQQTQGVQNNLAFEALTTSPTGTLPTAGEPLRVFAATEAALAQDSDPEQGEAIDSKIRWSHYLLSAAPPEIISEHLYQLELPPLGAIAHGLTEILALDPGGHFLSLERSFGTEGFAVKLFQANIATATDVSSISSLKGNIEGVIPIAKQLLLDLNALDITLDNLEGMVLGPRLPDGSQSLILVSDDNFRDDQITQFLLFRLRGL